MKIKKQSIAAEVAAPVTTTALTVPESAGALITSITGNTLPDVNDNRVNTLYFYARMSKQADAMRAAVPGIQEAQPVFFESVPNAYYAVERVYLLRADLWYTELDQEGSIVRATRDKKDRPFEEDYQAIVLVEVGDVILPARTSFRKTRAPACKSMVRKIAQLAEQHGSLAFMGVVGKLQLQSKTARSTGKAYMLVDALPLETSNADRERLVKTLRDPEFLEALQAVKDSYEERLKYLASRV